MLREQNEATVPAPAEEAGTTAGSADAATGDNDAKDNPKSI